MWLGCAPYTGESSSLQLHSLVTLFGTSKVSVILKPSGCWWNDAVLQFSDLVFHRAFWESIFSLHSLFCLFLGSLLLAVVVGHALLCSGMPDVRREVAECEKSLHLWWLDWFWHWWWFHLSTMQCVWDGVGWRHTWVTSVVEIIKEKCSPSSYNKTSAIHFLSLTGSEWAVMGHFLILFFINFSLVVWPALGASIAGSS